MCDINTLQQKIADLTNDGEIVIRFLAETVQGKTQAVQPCHRLEATRQLIRLGNLGDNTPSPSMGEGRNGGDRNKESARPEQTHPVRPEPVEGPTSSRHSREACPRPRSGSGNPEAQASRTSLMSDHTARPEPVEGPTSSRHSRESGNPVARDEESSLSSDNPVRPEPVEGHTSSRHSRLRGNPVAQTADENPTHSVTYLDILNFNLAQLIRSETADGHTIVEFLLHIMTGRDSAYTPNKLRIKPADRMAASREILRRGYGHFGRRRRLIDDAEETNDYDTLHTDLAKRLRQYSEEGSQVILFLLNVMKNEVPDEQYTTRHRMSAAQELLRRGWDTNYDKIKSEHLIDYWQDQQSARLSVGQKKQLAGLQTYADEYDALRQHRLRTPSPSPPRPARPRIRSPRPSSQQRIPPPFPRRRSRLPSSFPRIRSHSPSSFPAKAGIQKRRTRKHPAHPSQPPTPTKKTPTTTPSQTPTPSKTATTNP